MCFSSVFLTFNPEPSVCSMNAPANNPILLSDFSREQLLEILIYAAIGSVAVCAVARTIKMNKNRIKKMKPT